MTNACPKMSAIEGRAVSYILERRLSKGGFCFYRIEEPNGSDTFWALASLKTLDISLDDTETARFLKAFQQPDGSFESIHHAYYTIKGLRYLNEKPDRDPASYIRRQVKTRDVSRLPVGATSIFKELYPAVDLCHFLKMDLDKRLKKEISSYVLGFQKDSAGFGHPHAALVDTFQALMILAWLGHPIGNLGAEYFIQRCENPIFGFVDVPSSAPAFIEHIFSGIASCVVLGLKPRYIERCVEFVQGCQRRNGGFSRTADGGIATLEYTFLAVRTLNRLKALK